MSAEDEITFQEVAIELLNNEYLNSEGTANISGLAKINIFIGENNSGKSRLLRSIFSSQSQYFKFKNTNIEIADISFENLITSLENIYDCKFTIINSQPRDFYSFRKLTLINWAELEQSKPMNDIANKIISIIKSDQINFQFIRSGHSYSNSTSLSRYFDLKQTIIEACTNIITDNSFKGMKKYYLPTLRGLNCLDDTHETWTPYFERAIKRNYFPKNLPSSISIITGEDLYDSLNRKLRGTHDDRDSVKVFENFLSKNFFKNQPITLIPTYKKNFVTIKIGEDKDFAIHEVGDGIQQIILITYQMFLTKESSLFFLEEPDLFLHPSLQRKLVESFLKDSTINHHQFFLTTHSNHFLDVTYDYNDINIYKFKRDRNKTIISCSTGRDLALMQDLGIKPSSMFMTNSTIWVEGISDRLYLNHLLKVFINNKKLKKFEEDRHYTFIEYSGSNLTHYCFDDDLINIANFSPNNFLILDGDTTVTKKNWHIKLNSLNTIFSDSYTVLPVKEIENLILPSTFELLNNKNLGADEIKSLNKARLSGISSSQYAKKLSLHFSKSYGETTFNSKSELARKIINLESPSFDNNLLEPVLEKIYNFIDLANK